MTQQPLTFDSPDKGRDVPDIARRKHRGNAESREAAAKVHPHKSETYKLILSRLSCLYPMTAKEYAQDTRTPLHKISGRFSELRAGELIAPTKERRDGAAVLTITATGERALTLVLGRLATIEHEGNAAVVREREGA